MNIDIQTAKTPVGTNPNLGSADAATSPTGTVAPLIDGAGVTVTAMTTDFEKLLAKMELEREERRQVGFAQRFAAALLSIAGRYGSLTASQDAALQALTKASAAYEQAAAGQASAKGAYDAEVVKLAVLTEKLKALVDAQTKTPEEREKEIKAKETRAEDASEELADQERADQAKEIEELKAQIARQTDVVAGAKAKLDAAEGALAAAGTALAGATQKAMAALDGAQAKTIAAAVRQLAAEIAAAATERTDDGETVEKANVIIAAMEQYIEAVEEMKQEELEEMIAKVTVDLRFLLRAERTLKPGELGEYNETV